MSNPITFVTSLYNIDRENKGDGRKFDKYLSWFEDTLKIQSPMIVFVDQSLVSFVCDHRKELPTKIITQSLTEIPYYELTKSIDKILKSKEFKSKIGSPDRIECNLAIYNSIIYSKFQWIKLSIEENPFESEYFMWMDAGLSRFFYDIDFNYPSKNAIKSLLENKDKVLIQSSMSYYTDLVNSQCTEDYFWDARTWIMAGLWGGGKEILKEFCNKVDDVFRNKMIANGIVNNEQNAMAYIYKNNPEMFIVFENYADKHRPYEFIQELSK